MLKCRLTGRVFYNPVKSTNNDCQHVFEEEAIREHLSSSPICPCCPHEIKGLTPATEIKEQIAAQLLSGKIQLFQLYFSRTLLRDAIMAGKDSAALQTFIFILYLGVDAAYLYVKRGENKLAANDPNGALQDCNLALENHFDCASAYVLRAKVNLQVNKLHSAILDASWIIDLTDAPKINQPVGLDQMLKTCLVVRARALLIMGRVKDAILDLNAASALIKDDETAQPLREEIVALKIGCMLPNRLLAQPAPTFSASTSSNVLTR